jgi:5'-nucleotidase
MMRNSSSFVRFALTTIVTVTLLGCAQSSTKLSKESDAIIPARAFQSTDPNQLTIAVVGLNDVHGSLLPRDKLLSDGRIVRSGGASALYSMVSLLKKEMNGNLIVVDAGDEWQGTLESNSVKGATVVEFFNRLGVKVAAIGNHEFDFAVPAMTKRFSEAKYPYVAANIFLKGTDRHPKWNNYYPSRLIKIAGLKIGVIGYSTEHTPTTTRAEFVVPYEFRDPVVPVTEQAKLLRKQGAQIVLVTAHAGTICEDKKGLKDWSIRSAATDQSACDETDEIYLLAQKLKPGSIDGIIAGHTHQVIHHWLNQIPTVQDEAHNQYFNVIYYTFDRTTKKMIPELTRIEGLVPICSEVFEGLNHCDVRRLAVGKAPKLVAASFHGSAVLPDPKLEVWLAPLRKNVDQFKAKVLTHSELPMTHFRDREGAMGNLVADALRKRAGSDFSLVNSGGIRTALDAGPITYEGLFRALPFDNLMNVVRLKGKDVKMLYRVATSGSHGICEFSGLKLKLIPFDRNAERTDLDHNGRLDEWETNRLVEITTTDGKPIIDDQEYTIATFDFLVTGGDDLGFVMKKIPKKDILLGKTGYSRDIVVDYLQGFKVINTKEHPLVDPSHPRVEFVK